MNALRGHTAELGIIVPQGIGRVADLVIVLMGEDTIAVPALARQTLCCLAAELEAWRQDLGALRGRNSRRHASATHSTKTTTNVPTTTGGLPCDDAVGVHRAGE